MSDNLRAALMNLRLHDLNDGPCWCTPEPNAANEFRHVRACQDARAALASSSLGMQTTGEGLDVGLLAFVLRQHVLTLQDIANAHMAGQQTDEAWSILAAKVLARLSEEGR